MQQSWWSIISVAVAIVIGVNGAPQSDDEEFESWIDNPHMNLTAIDEESLPVASSLIDYPAGFEDKVNFYLYTKKTRDSPISTLLTASKLFGGVKINASIPVKILIHGYFSGKDRFFAKTVREAFLDAPSDYYVINVDWSAEAHRFYTTARHEVPIVGAVVSQFIDKFSSQYGIKPEDLHVIGHSLGAHIAGIAGLRVMSGKLKRVTGLDPAGPMFSCEDQERIKPESALFVDIIHTCGKGLGFYDTLGHVDFYPNHGWYPQPGCGVSVGKCSHERSALLYAESVGNPDGFIARRCDHWSDFEEGNCDNNPTAVLGENTPADTRGKYCLSTGANPPYALGEGSLKANASSHGWHLFPVAAAWIERVRQ